jgi:hypothetical protein
MPGIIGSGVHTLRPITQHGEAGSAQSSPDAQGMIPPPMPVLVAGKPPAPVETVVPVVLEVALAVLVVLLAVLVLVVLLEVLELVGSPPDPVGAPPVPPAPTCAPEPAEPPPAPLVVLVSDSLPVAHATNANVPRRAGTRLNPSTISNIEDSPAGSARIGRSEGAIIAERCRGCSSSRRCV